MAENDSEIFERLRNIETTVVRIDEREAHMMSDHRDIKAQVNDHEKRLQDIEKKDARRSGFLAAIITGASIVVNGVIWILKQLFGGN